MRCKYQKNVPVLDKLISRYQSVGSCWEWTAGKDRAGYGRIWYKDKNQTAHTVAYSVFVGPIPAGLHVRHNCDNPACINPEHLCLGTHQDNMRDKTIRKRIHGERNPNSKYTDKQRELAQTSVGSPKKVAEKLGMSVPHVCNLRKAYQMEKFQ